MNEQRSSQHLVHCIIRWREGRFNTAENGDRSKDIICAAYQIECKGTRLQCIGTGRVVTTAMHSEEGPGETLIGITQ